MADLSEILQRALGARYSVERELGRGGMGSVFLARDTKHDSPVAIKILLPEIARDLGNQRFLQEVQLAARLTHPHVLRLLDSGMADGLPFFIMPYASEGSLRVRLRREKQLSVTEAIRVSVAVAGALQSVHDEGFVHRDIKPENILFLHGEPVLSDFGIAHAIRAAGTEHLWTQLTTQGTVLGTPAYMSPEQASGAADVDARSDIYSLSCVLFEMLAGQPPFTGPTTGSLIAQHLSASPPDVSVLRRGVSETAKRAIESALAKTPADRPASAREWAASLVSTLPIPRQDSRHGTGRPRMVGAVAVGAVLVAVLLGWWLNPAKRGPSQSPVRDVIAILPFQIHGGNDLDWLSEGIPSLLSTNLDGTGLWRVADPNAVARRSARLGDEADLVELARPFSAGIVIRGDAFAIGDRLRLSAGLYEPDSGRVAIGTVSVEGAPDSLEALSEKLSRSLIALLPGLPNQHLKQLASLEGSSLPALKRYLRAEYVNRTRPASEALPLYWQAVELDSSFALAWYRISTTSPWMGSGDQNGFATALRAIQNAIRHSSNLPERDRARFLAWQASLKGNVLEADHQYNRVLSDRPDDLDALEQLALLRYQYNPSQGLPSNQAAGVYEHILRIDPENNCLYEYCELARRNGEFTLADSLRRRVEALHGPDPGWQVQDLLKQGTSAATSRAFEIVRGLPSQEAAITVITSHAAAASRAPDFLERVFQEPRFQQSPTLRLFAQVACFATGRSKDGWRNGDALSRLAPTGSIAFEAGFLASPHYPASEAELRRCLAKLTAWDSVPAARIPAWTPGLHRQTRLYLMGLLEARLRMTDSALVRASTLEQWVGSDFLGAQVEDFIHSIRSFAAFWQGHDEEALRHLERCNNRLFMAGGWQRRRWLEQFQRAELNFKLGRRDEALRWYNAALDINGTFFFAAPSYFRRAQIREESGDFKGALADYRSFVNLYSRCDKEFRHLVTQAQTHIARLERALG